VSAVAVAESEDVLPRYLEEARDIISSEEADPSREPIGQPSVTEEFERVRWFPLPGEGLAPPSGVRSIARTRFRQSS
jgi:hypothetical protein